MKQLPDKMIHQMVDFLNDASDFPTLLNCSLVCHVWNDICRPKAFHTVVVRSQNLHARLGFLHFTAPHLSKHIVELTLQWDDCILTTPEWIPDCLLRLKSLRALRLKNCRSEPPPMVPAPFSMGILSLISSVPLEALYLESWSFLEDASDLLHILSCCSATLEDLFIQKTAYDHGTIVAASAERRVSSTVRLEALRSLRLFEWIGDTPLPSTDLIECPNLEHLEVTRTHAGPWDIPSWIPAGLSELVLQVEPGTWMPGLGTSIRPSRLTIEIINQGYSIATYLEVMEWVEDCIDHHIPFPDLLRYLTVKINTYPRSLGPDHSPEFEDYVAMSAALQQIHERLNLTPLTEHWSARNWTLRSRGWWTQACSMSHSNGPMGTSGRSCSMSSNTWSSTWLPSVEPRNLPNSALLCYLDIGQRHALLEAPNAESMGRGPPQRHQAPP